MRKSALEQQINIVIEKNNALFTKCNELEQLNLEKDNKIRELLNEIENLKNENQTLCDEISDLKNSALTQIVENDTVVVEQSEISESSADIEPAKEILPETIQRPLTEAVAENKMTHGIDEAVIENISSLKSTLLANNKLDSASSAIGRVVMKCTETCNTFVSAGNVNSKDLVNLALGRTEVFKSEVLSLATANDISIDMFNAELSLKETSVLEYFELLLKQI